jgi:large subunit ribosomal protein L23
MSKKAKTKTEQRAVIGMEKALMILRSPLVTEKSTAASQYGQYGFITVLDATKAEIKSAIEQIFKVKVESVNTMIQKGKIKRFRGREGCRSDIKKAYVRLEKGYRLDIGAGV